jgi:hypothetical protein
MLDHDGKIVVESTVINEYLDDIFPTPALRPAEPYKLAQMRVWTRMTDENIHAAAGVVTTAIAYRHVPSHGNQIAGALDPYKQAHKIASFEDGLDNVHFRTAMRRYDMLMDQIDAALAGKGPGAALAGGGIGGGLAGAPGFEPGNDGIKTRCLTAWLRPTTGRACVARHFLTPNAPAVATAEGRRIPSIRLLNTGPAPR